MTEMKTLTINDVTYEIVDGVARTAVENIPTTVEEILKDAPNITVKDGEIKLASVDGLEQMIMSELGFSIITPDDENASINRIVSVIPDRLQFVGPTKFGKVTGLAAPEEDDHAANKKYVNDAIAAAIGEVLEGSY